jgi:hypothetical protein
MKLLQRLRTLAAEFPIEPSDLSFTYEVIPLDLGRIENEDDYGFESTSLAADGSAGLPTVDGLRRRLPEVHEEIPPEGYMLFADGTAALE